MSARAHPLRNGLFAGLALAGLALPASAQPMELDVTGGGIGEVLTLNLSGPPSAQYLMLMSLVTGPTALPAPHVSPIDVGLELIDLCLSAPGFIGALSPAGTLSLPILVPANPALDNLNLNFQVFRFQNGVLKEKSNLWRVTFETPGEFAFTLGDLAQARAFGTSNLLPDGSVLVAGGGQGSLTSATGLNTAERYRVNLESFDALPVMNSARALHRAVTLADGRVLLVGGVDGAGVPLASAEVYDPVADTFTPSAPMSVARCGHTASLLPDGRVLVTGGSSDFTDATAFITSAKNTSEIWNPGTNSFSAGPNMSAPRTFHDACTLQDGRVIVTGGLTFTVIIIPIPDISSTAQVYQPNAGAGSFGANVGMPAKRAAHTSVLLADGRVLLVGGAAGSILAPTPLATCALYAPSVNSFLAAGSLATARALPALTRLPNGQVLAAGGATGDLTNLVSLASCERYTPTPPLGAGSWATAGDMNVSRLGHGAVRLSDGTVGLFAGGGGPGNAALNTAEIWQP